MSVKQRIRSVLCFLSFHDNVRCTEHSERTAYFKCLDCGREWSQGYDEYVL